MNDGVTRAILNTGLLSSGNSQATQIKVLELPQGLQKNNTVSGEVLSNENGRVTLKTPQGNVVFEADIPVQVGQKISLKLQVMVQNAQKNLYIEVIGLGNAQAPKPVEQPLPNAPIKLPDAVQLSQLMHEYDTALPDKLSSFPLLDYKAVKLPAVLSQEAIDVLMKEILNYPISRGLPPPLQEGMDKIKLLLPLLTQFMPQGSNSAAPSTATPNDIILSIRQILQMNAETTSTLTQLLIQKIALLQMIPPGAAPTKDIIASIMQQLISLQPQVQTPLQENLLQTVPLLSLVLGQKNIPVAGQATPQTMLLSFMPQGEQMLAFVTSSADENGLNKPLLPGTVLIAAAPQKAIINLQSLQITPALIEAMPELLPLKLGMGDTWPAIEDLWNSLLQHSGTLPDASITMRQTIPTPTQAMTPTMLLFMAALKMGAPDQWFGENFTKALAQIDKTNVLTQLTRDMQALRGNLLDSSPSDTWRPLPMPLQIGNELVRLQWFYRHQQDEGSSGSQQDEAENKKRRKTRFIVDVPKTRLGDIQIDGLMQEQNLDLILRTENTMALFMEGAIRDRYHKALEASNMVGEINFQSGRQQYVKV